MYYFGCKSENEKGHYFYKEGMVKYESCFDDHDKHASSFLYSKLDGGFCPKTETYQEQGKAKLTHISSPKRRFTILAFWDRSADGRGNSNSAFVRGGTHDFETVLSEAKEKFPEIFSRFNFEIVEFMEQA